MSISPERIAATLGVIRPHVRQTPIIDLDGSEIGLGGVALTLKLELHQHGGAFKARGAFTNLMTRPLPPTGVVAASGGNHGVAVAYAAMKLCVPAKIFVPSISSLAKIERIRNCGADLVVGGECYADALEASQIWAEHSGSAPVHAYDQEETILGQGTVGIELDEQAPGLDAVVVPVGGGGLISGVATWFHGRTKIVGVEPVAAPTLTRALEAGRPVDAEAGGIAADSLGPRRVGELVFPIAQRWVDRVVLVSDEAIQQAQRELWRLLRIVAEPGGAAAFSALLSGRYRPMRGQRVGVVVSGGNTTAVDFSR